MAEKTLREGNFIFVNGQLWDAESQTCVTKAELKRLAKEKTNE